MEAWHKIKITSPWRLRDVHAPPSNSIWSRGDVVISPSLAVWPEARMHGAEDGIWNVAIGMTGAGMFMSIGAIRAEDFCC
jgi:hypothetical protein